MAIAFYFYEFFLRIIPGLIVDDLMSAFHINAVMVGTLSAGYLYVYAPMQIPVGLLMDRFGPRRLLTLGALMCGVGSIVFGVAFDFDLAFMGRVMMGFGSSFAFVGMVYISSQYFSGKKLTILIGIANSFGMMGALWGEDTLGYFVDHYSWQSLSVVLGIFGIILAIGIWGFCAALPLPKRPSNKKVDSFRQIGMNLCLVCKNPQTWINAIVASAIYATTTAFAGLWGVNFIKEAYGYSEESAAISVSLIFLGWMVGGPLFGYLAHRRFTMRAILMVTSLCGGICLSLAIYVLTHSYYTLCSLFFLVGFFSSSQLLNFSYSIFVNKAEAKGTAVAFTNFLVMIVGSALQPFVGYLIDYHANGVSTSGISVDDYQFALFCFPLSFFLAVSISGLMKKIELEHFNN
ncbi:MAG: MFS transporter [Chlamydiota bacterium]|nr:MFS transporter [Chlamydiota bacterium]